MEQPKEQLTEFLDGLTQRVLSLGAVVRMYEELWFCMRSELIEGLKTAPSFFQITMAALWRYAVIELDKFFDDGKRAKKSLFYFHRRVQENLRAFDISDDSAEAARMREAGDGLETMRPIVKRVKVHRDKKHAHDDPKCFDRPFQLHEETPLPFDDLMELVQTAENVILIHHQAFREVHLVMRMPAAGHEAVRVVSGLRHREIMIRHPTVKKLIMDGDLPPNGGDPRNWSQRMNL